MAAIERAAERVAAAQAFFGALPPPCGKIESDAIDFGWGWRRRLNNKVLRVGSTFIFVIPATAGMTILYAIKQPGSRVSLAPTSPPDTILSPKHKELSAT